MTISQAALQLEAAQRAEAIANQQVAEADAALQAAQRENSLTPLKVEQLYRDTAAALQRAQEAHQRVFDQAAAATAAVAAAEQALQDAIVQSKQGGPTERVR